MDRPTVVLVSLHALANAVGCCLSSARSIARADDVLVDSWDPKNANLCVFPETHRYWIPGAWLNTKIAEMRAEAFPIPRDIPQPTRHDSTDSTTNTTQTACE